MARLLYRLRGLERRANTIHRNAEALMSDMMDIYGAEGMIGGDNATDDADSLVHAAETLCEMIERAIHIAKETP